MKSNTISLTKITVARRAMMFALVVMLGGMFAFAQKQLSPPRIMIVPDMIYCKNNGYTQTFNVNGVTTEVPDYERALSEDPTLHSVLTQIAQLLTDENNRMVIIDLLEAINSAKMDEAMADANGGDTSESVDEAIIRSSNADILVKVQYDIVKNGPEYRIAYTLKGTDPYTSYNFAPIEGLGAPSTAASPVVMLRAAVIENMPAFCGKLLDYYTNMCKDGGRMVAFEIKTTSTSSVDMNTRVGSYQLREVIDDFLYDNSVDGKGLESLKSGNTFMQYQGVYIPLTTEVRGRPRKQSARDVAQKLVNYLDELGIHANYKVIGLGKVNIYID